MSLHNSSKAKITEEIIPKSTNNLKLNEIEQNQL